MIFVFDRTENDLISKTNKAYINASDLNRIESNISVIAEEIGASITPGKTDWTRTDLPRINDFQRIINNTTAIRNGYTIASDTPLVPSRPLNTYDKWNAIERILYDVDMQYKARTSAQMYTTEIWANDQIGVI